MATRIIEPLIINGDNGDHVAVKNWLSRLTSAIEIALFSNSNQLPDDEAAKEAMIASLKKNYLLASIGAVGFKFLRSYCSPNEPSTQTFDQLITVLRTNLAPEPNAISEQYQFSMLRQETGESMASYFSRVKHGASTCDFEAKYDQMVRNQFIYGLRDSKIRTSMLSCENNQTSQQIFKKAVDKERANTSNIEMQGSSSKVNSVQKSQWNRGNSNNKNKFFNKKTSPPSARGSDKSTGLVCSKCTLRGHKASECKVRCNYCKGTGHIVKNCPKSARGRRVHQVGEGSDDMYGMVNNGEDQDEDDSYQVQQQGNFNHVDPQLPNVHFVPMHKVGEASEGNVPDKGNRELMLNTYNFENDFIPKLNLKNSKCNSVKTNFKPMLKIMLNGKYVTMEVDTGAAVSCMSRKNFDKLKLTGCKVEKCHMNLCVANGSIVRASLKATVVVKFREYCCNLPLYVVESEFPTLLGIEWIQALFGKDWLSRMIGWSVNHVISREAFIEEVKSSTVFLPGMGNVTGFEACIDLKPNAVPKFCKARPPPFAHAKAIEKKLDDLVKEDVLEPVDHSEYASPVHPVIKPDGDIRLCGDYKRTLNPNIDTKTYPLPVIEDCLWEMRGGDVYTKLDIKQAYNHLSVRECDQKLTTINTHKGLYQWKRLPFGVSSASAIFQSVMDRLLSGLSGVTCRVDDILITGKDDTEHMSRVLEVIGRLERAGFRCRLDKSQFMVSSVVYLGHVVSKQGIQPVRTSQEG